MPETGPIDIELFAGAGGLAIGMKAAGFFPANFYEVDEFCCRTLRHNISSNDRTLIGNVFEEKAEKIDWTPLQGRVRLLAAGTPCQPFSLGGKHLADKDGRNLFPELLRAVRELQPHAVFLENVRGLSRDSFRPYFEYVLRHLECPSLAPRPGELWQNHDRRLRKFQLSIGYEPEYHVSFRLVEAADYGVPQNRQRVFIVSTRRDYPAYEFPRRTHSRAALVHDQKSGTYWERHGIRRRTSVNEQHVGDCNGEKPWATTRDALVGLPKAASCEADSEMNHWSISGARAYHGHSGSLLDWPAKTIKAGVHGVPGGENTVIEASGGLRYFTLRETARIQTFPDSHLFDGARIHVTRQIGNAVPCQLAEALAKSLFKLLHLPTRS